jgi:hypothetical protein
VTHEDRKCAFAPATAELAGAAELLRVVSEPDQMSLMLARLTRAIQPTCWLTSWTALRRP